MINHDTMFARNLNDTDVSCRAEKPHEIHGQSCRFAVIIFFNVSSALLKYMFKCSMPCLVMSDVQLRHNYVHGSSCPVRHHLFEVLFSARLH